MCAGPAGWGGPTHAADAPPGPLTRRSSRLRYCGGEGTAGTWVSVDMRLAVNSGHARRVWGLHSGSRAGYNVAPNRSAW